MRVDLNSDLGETVNGVRTADDDAMFGVISSANIACGFHAGDPETMRRLCDLAVERGVSIGAHVSYRDARDFGRTDVEVEHGVLIDDVLEQIAVLENAARPAGTRVAYVKPHGALYNRIARDESRADAVAVAASSFSPSLMLMGLPGSAIERAAAEHGVPFVGEGFADRAYRDDGSLVPRTTDGAVLTGDDRDVAGRAVTMVTTGVVPSISGAAVRVRLGSLCVHGDTPGAVRLARRVREALAAAGVDVRSFAR
ncbi:5-oxoprolinase subunit PxpA [Okibacterium endophyticum]